MTILRSILEKPGYTFMRGVARFGAVRCAVTSLRAMADRRGLAQAVRESEARIAASSFAGLDRERFLRELSEEGLALGLTLPPEIVGRIVAWARQQPCYADRDTRYGFTLDRRTEAEERLGKPILLAQYFNTLRDCADIRNLADDPVLQWIAARYLGSTPTFVGANLWWTFPVNALAEDRFRHAHLFHRDVDDFRFFKFFFYLTDVPAGEGAHVCVVGSHKNPPVLRARDHWLIRRYSDAEIDACYPSEKITELCGPAGTGFAEDTLCTHKGNTPQTAPRLLLQLQFALFDYGVMHDVRAPDTLVRLA